MNFQETEMEKRHRTFCRRAAADGMVLLKNEDRILPVAKGRRIAVYGGGAMYTVKGGTGSGEVNNRGTVSILDGLTEAGYKIINSSWLKDYRGKYEEARKAWEEKICSLAGPEKDYDKLCTLLAENPLRMPKGQTVMPGDIPDWDCKNSPAFYVISRVPGEGCDRKNEKGDYYLSDTETEELGNICSIFSKVIVILNVGSVIDLGFADEFNIKGILLMSLAGMEGGNALADLISGRMDPSGKLADTWAYRYEDYPSGAGFGRNNGNVHEEYYTDGIYVGYRYFDSFKVRPRYPFGYGLSYTSFSVRYPEEAALDGHTVTVKADVTNTGKNAGREVVQLYVSCPWGIRKKEQKRLAAFAKTKPLFPGRSQRISLSFDLEQLLSYHTGRASWFLEAGRYLLLAGTASDNVTAVGILELKDTVWMEKGENICPLLDALSEIEPSDDLFKDLRSDAVIMRQDTDAADKDSLPAIAAAGILNAGPVSIDDAAGELKESWTARKKTGYTGVNNLEEINERFAAMSFAEDESTRQFSLIKEENVAAMPDDNGVFRDARGLAEYLTLSEKAAVVCGGYEGTGIAAMGNASEKVPGAAGETTEMLLEKGVGQIVFADGPTGLRLQQCYEEDPVTGLKFIYNDIERLENSYFGKEFSREGWKKHYQYCSALPSGTLLAQTFDEKILESAGEIVGEEMKEYNISVWLAPGMNIHRNPLCGRNFEYYSEDPLVSGRMAAAITRGVQKDSTLSVAIRHFACNNQEDNRRGVSAVVSERALREIYLKGFEIAVRSAQPHAIMTSCNKINGVHSANNYDLCTVAARNEWGFEGLIMTDWTTTNICGGSSAAKCIAAGNDLIMPGRPSDIREIIDAVEQTGDQSLSEKLLDISVERVLRLIMSSRQ